MKGHDGLDDAHNISGQPTQSVVEFVLGIVSYFSTDLQSDYLLAVSFNSAKISSILSSNRVRDDSLDPITEICFDDTAHASPAAALTLDHVVLDFSTRPSVVSCMSTSVTPLLTSSLLSSTQVGSAHVGTPWTTRRDWALWAS